MLVVIGLTARNLQVPPQMLNKMKMGEREVSTAQRCSPHLYPCPRPSPPTLPQTVPRLQQEWRQSLWQRNNGRLWHS